MLPSVPPLSVFAAGISAASSVTGVSAVPVPAPLPGIPGNVIPEPKSGMDPMSGIPDGAVSEPVPGINPMSGIPDGIPPPWLFPLSILPISAVEISLASIREALSVRWPWVVDGIVPSSWPRILSARLAQKVFAEAGVRVTLWSCEEKELETCQDSTVKK